MQVLTTTPPPLLHRYEAISAYSGLLFAQMHDGQIAELAALALVNLISEVPLADCQSHLRGAAR
jgi:hypothetical protein